MPYCSISSRIYRGGKQFRELQLTATNNSQKWKQKWKTFFSTDLEFLFLDLTGGESVCLGQNRHNVHLLMEGLHELHIQGPETGEQTPQSFNVLIFIYKCKLKKNHILLWNENIYFNSNSIFINDDLLCLLWIKWLECTRWLLILPAQYHINTRRGHSSTSNNTGMICSIECYELFLSLCNQARLCSVWKPQSQQY